MSSWHVSAVVILLAPVFALGAFAGLGIGLAFAAGLGWLVAISFLDRP